MNAKKAIIIGSLVAATILPFSSNGQQTTNKTKKDLIENINGKNNKINEKPANVVDYQKQTLLYINEIRKQHKLSPLKYDKTLENLAREQSKYLKENRPVWHKLESGDHFDKKYSLPIHRIEKARWERLDLFWEEDPWSEVIVTIDQNSIKRLVDLRMESKKGHRERILGAYTHMWVSYEKGSNFFIVVFAREKPQN